MGLRSLVWLLPLLCAPVGAGEPREACANTDADGSDAAADAPGPPSAATTAGPPRVRIDDRAAVAAALSTHGYVVLTHLVPDAGDAGDAGVDWGKVQPHPALPLVRPSYCCWCLQCAPWCDHCSLAKRTAAVCAPRVLRPHFPPSSSLPSLGSLAFSKLAHRQS